MKTQLPLLLAGVPLLVGALAVPMIMRIVPRNPLYGFRTRKTLSSDERWYEANYFSGWTLIAAGVVSAVSLFVIAMLADDLSESTVHVSSIVALLVPLFGASIASLLFLRRIP